MDKADRGADNIELIGVLGWVCIAKKGEFQVGDLAVYIEIDSKCPDNDERFAFLAAKHYKIKTMKLGKFKVFSQGLAMPVSLFPELLGKSIGSDVTKELKITYSSEEDLKRKSNGVDPNAKYKSMAQRKPKIFKNPIVKRIMRHESGRRFMFFYLEENAISRRRSRSGLLRLMKPELRMLRFISTAQING